MNNRLRCTIIVLLAGLLQPGTSAAATDAAELQRLVDGLRVIVRDARRDGTAERHFLNELQSFIDEHDQPSSAIVVSDDFADGELDRSPTWRSLSGQHAVDRRYGMVATPTTSQQRSGGSNREREVVNALLGAILQGSGGQAGAGPQTPARIETAASTANAFSLEADISGMANGASISFILAQGAQGDTGYRLVVEPEGQASLRIERSVRSRTATVATHRAGLASATGGARQISWTRARNGVMRVSVNGQTLLKVTDRGLRDGFARLAIEAAGGQVAIRRIQVTSDDR